ncbi:globoside alpha-1,3-N-acetylgalactosaminyltransferase 1-like [Clarias gariepinus]
MRFGQNLFLFLLIIFVSLLGIFHFSLKSTWLRGASVCKKTVGNKKHVNMDLIFPPGDDKKDVVMDLIFPPGIDSSQPSVNSRRPDVAMTTQWLAPIVWEDTFDLTVFDNIYKPKNITVATTFFALGQYVRFLKDLLESAEQHFFVGYRVHYYVFTDLPNEVPMVTLGEEHQLTVIKTAISNQWQKLSLHRMEMIEKLIEEELINKADYIFSLSVDTKFYGHWGAESVGDLVGVMHAWFLGKPREQFTYERHPESKGYIPLEEGDYYYGADAFGGRPKNVLKLVRTCRIKMEEDYTNQIEAVWQEESHLNKYFLFNKPTKVLSPEYHWDDKKEKPSYIKVVRFSRIG